MSFLSRIRKTVTPTSKAKVNTSSSSTNGGAGDRKRSVQRSSYREKVDDDDQLHNYRKSTKSFNEKSLKPKNTYHSYGNSDEDEHRWRSTKPLYKSNDTKRTATHTPSTGKSTKSSFHTPTLSRSDTFTLDEENDVQNGTYMRYKKKDNTEYGGDDSNGRSNGDNSYYYTNSHTHANHNDLKSDTSLTRNQGKTLIGIDSRGNVYRMRLPIRAIFHLHF